MDFTRFVSTVLKALRNMRDHARGWVFPLSVKVACRTELCFSYFLLAVGKYELFLNSAPSGRRCTRHTAPQKLRTARRAYACHTPPWGLHLACGVHACRTPCVFSLHHPLRFSSPARLNRAAPAHPGPPHSSSCTQRNRIRSRRATRRCIARSPSYAVPTPDCTISLPLQHRSHASPPPPTTPSEDWDFPRLHPTLGDFARLLLHAHSQHREHRRIRKPQFISVTLNNTSHATSHSLSTLPTTRRSLVYPLSPPINIPPTMTTPRRFSSSSLRLASVQPPSHVASLWREQTTLHCWAIVLPSGRPFTLQ